LRNVCFDKTLRQGIRQARTGFGPIGVLSEYTDIGGTGAGRRFIQRAAAATDRTVLLLMARGQSVPVRYRHFGLPIFVTAAFKQSGIHLGQVGESKSMIIRKGISGTGRMA
jgi:hypothetical protein